MGDGGTFALGETRTEARAEARPPTLHNSMPPYLIRYPLPQGFVSVYAFCAMILLSCCPPPPLLNTQLLFCVGTFPPSLRLTKGEPPSLYTRPPLAQSSTYYYVSPYACGWTEHHQS